MDPRSQTTISPLQVPGAKGSTLRISCVTGMDDRGGPEALWRTGAVRDPLEACSGEDRSVWSVETPIMGAGRDRSQPRTQMVHSGRTRSAVASAGRDKGRQPSCSRGRKCRYRHPWVDTSSDGVVDGINAVQDRLIRRCGGGAEGAKALPRHKIRIADVVHDDVGVGRNAGESDAQGTWLDENVASGGGGGVAAMAVVVLGAVRFVARRLGDAKGIHVVPAPDQLVIADIGRVVVRMARIAPAKTPEPLGLMWV